MTTGLAGKTALITGAGRGIGRALALGLGAAGARLALLTPRRSAAPLIARISGDETGKVWDVADDLP